MSSESYSIDAPLFRKRVKLLQSIFTPASSAHALLNGATSLLVVTGKQEEDHLYQKSITLHTWLLGYEFPSTAMLITKEKVIFVTSSSKGKLLEGLGATVWSRIKNDEAHNKKLFLDLADAISKEGNTVGKFFKDTFSGPFVSQWEECIAKHISSDASEDLKWNFVDLSAAVSTVLSIHAEDELKAIKKASMLSQVILNEYFNDQIFKIIDDERKVPHSKISNSIDALLDNDKFFKSKPIAKTVPDLDPTRVEWCYTPIIMSGGNYDLKPSAYSNDDNLHSGVIIGELGIRYMSYCSNIVRTYLVDPNSSIEKHYKLLLALQKRIFDSIKDGVIVKDVYNAALDFINSKDPSLESHFLRTIGWSTGIEFRDSSFLINLKNTRPFRENMTLIVSIGFSDLTNPDPSDKQSEKYALLISDTIRVNKSAPPTLYTDSPKSLQDIAYYFEQSDSEPEKEKKSKSKSKVKKEDISSESESQEESEEESESDDGKNKNSKSKSSKNSFSSIDKKKKKSSMDGDRSKSKKFDSTEIAASLRSKTRGIGRQEQVESAESKRKERQRDLHERIQEEGLERYADTSYADTTPAKQSFKRFESFKRDTQIPSSVRDLHIVVDHKAQTIIVPISGKPVPFHINTIRNASKNDEGDYTYLRLNFLIPSGGVAKRSAAAASSGGGNNGSALATADNNTPFENPNATFIRSLTFRSRDSVRIAEVCKGITEMKRDAVKRETERRELEDVVVQGRLIESKRALRLNSLFVRPSPDGRRNPGSVEIHENGLRYVSPIRSDHSIDILFSNIKHLFFQPCDHELIAVIHCHLKHPILIGSGKKKTFDVQFYREASDVAFDETGNRRRKYRYGDEDELEAEQEERKRRAALNKEFHNFSEKISEASRGLFEVDIPFRELGFNGVPFRANVLCLPTTDCLVQLIEPPFLVVTLSEIEIVHLERVQYGLKNFDLVIVYKDFTKPVVHINSIPMEQLDNVRDWLTEVEIPYYHGPLNLNWPQIMKTIIANPLRFFQEGGWTFLTTPSDDENSGSAESETASEFEASDTDPSDESEAYSEGEDEDDDEEEYSESEDGSDAESILSDDE